MSFSDFLVLNSILLPNTIYRKKQIQCCTFK